MQRRHRALQGSGRGGAGRRAAVKPHLRRHKARAVELAGARIEAAAAVHAARDRRCRRPARRGLRGVSNAGRRAGVQAAVSASWMQQQCKAEGTAVAERFGASAHAAADPAALATAAVRRLVGRNRGTARTVQTDQGRAHLLVSLQGAPLPPPLPAACPSPWPPCNTTAHAGRSREQHHAPRKGGPAGSGDARCHRSLRRPSRSSRQRAAASQRRQPQTRHPAATSSRTAAVTGG